MGMLKDDYDINIIGRLDYADFPEGSGEITLNTTGSYTRRAGRVLSPIKSMTRKTPRSAAPLC